MSRRTARTPLVLGLGVLGLSAAWARRVRPDAFELASFDAVNGLPDALSRPLWPVMQLGALAAVPAVAGAVWLAGDPALAKRLAVSGTATWVLAKGVKRVVRRGRPAAVLPAARIRGHEQSGGGFPSGHAAIAAALAAGVAPVVPGLAPLLVSLAGTVALARVYVGAHLPLDVIGGAALGLVVNATVELALPS